MYYLVKGILYLFSLQPFWLMYLHSDILFFWVWYVFGYRKQVVFDNLKHAFPDKSPEARKAIARKFYRHFIDTLFEIIKQLSISAPSLKKRVRHENPEVIPEMTAHGGGGVAIFAHYANWEWLGAGMGLQLPFATVGVYKPLKNKLFDRLVKHIRTRLGNDMIAMSQTYRESIKRLREPCYIAFLSDQTPFRQGKEQLYFTQFLNRPAAVHLGTATIALKMQVPAYYFDIRKEKRGFYRVKLVRMPVEEFLPYSPENAQRFTDYHVKYLEKVISGEPAYWLWSHRRWKRKIQSGDPVSPEVAEFLS